MIKYSNFTEEDIVLCKDSYKPLCLIELFLKNQIDVILTKHYDESWLQSDKLKLHFKEREKINKIIHRNDNVYNKEFLMNNLTLGFWTGLLHKYYHHLLWRNNDTIKELLPHLDNIERSLLRIEKDLNLIRQFRNKVFHFNSIKNDNLEKINRILTKIIFGITGKNTNDIRLN